MHFEGDLAAGLLDSEIFWCRDLPPASSAGFYDYFLDGEKDHCTRRDAFRFLRWDSAGHFQVDDPSTFFPRPDRESIASSASFAECYRISVVGRFHQDGPCSSEFPSSCSSSQHFCGVSGSTGDDYDLEINPKRLELCFDEAGHLQAIYLCDILRWHIHGWHEGTDPGSTSSPQDDFSAVVSDPNFQSAGVVVELFLWIPSSEPSSASCDLSIRSQCESLAVKRALFWFDSAGHLVAVTHILNDDLACGVYSPCEGGPVPKTMLVEIEIFNLVEDALHTSPWHQCVLVFWDGCVWSGQFLIPCCEHIGGIHPSVILTYEVVDFRIACVRRRTGPFSVPWYICFAGHLLEFSHFNGCPLDGAAGGVYLHNDSRGNACDELEINFTVSEIPCEILCPSDDFVCRAPSLSGPGGGGGGSMSAAPTSLDVTAGAGSFVLTWTGLTANILFSLSGTNPSGFELSLTGPSSGFASSQTVSYGSGSGSVTMWVRKITPALPVHNSCNVDAASTGATTVSVPVVWH